MLRRLLIALPLLMAACLGDPREHLDKARELTYQRQPAAALKEYEEVISLQAKKDSEKVRETMAAALKGAGDLCYLELKDYRRAAEYYRTLCSRYPDAPETLDARANLAEIYGALGDRRSAVAELSTIVQAFPRAPEIDRFQYLAAKAYFELGDYDQAALECRVLQERYATSDYRDDAQMLLGTSLTLLGQREKAIEAFEQLAGRWPESELAPRARFEEAKVLSDLGREDQAVEVLVEALKTHPDPKGVQSEIARLRKRLALRRPNTDRDAIWREGSAKGIP